AVYRRPAPGAAAVSPDGRWVAVGSYSGRGVEVFDAASGAAVATVAADARHPVPDFTPDGRTLIVGTYGAFTFWDVGTWSAAGRRDREPGCDHPGRVAFTAGGALAAWVVGRETVLVTDAGGRPLARLPVAGGGRARQPLFSPDGRTLAVLTGADLHLWDLPAVREGLREVGLDWADDQPPPPGPPPSAAEVRVAGAHRLRAGWRSLEAFVYAPAHLALNPTGPDGHLWLGLYLARERNDPEAAIPALNLATLADPDLPTAYQARIEAYWKLGRWADLLADADRYREVCGPGRWEPERRYYRGAALQQLGRHREAVAELTAALDGGASGGVRGLALEARAISLYATNQQSRAREDLAAAKLEKADKGALVARLQYLLFFPPGGRLNRNVALYARDVAQGLAADGGAYEAALNALALIRINTTSSMLDGLRAIDRLSGLPSTRSYQVGWFAAAIGHHRRDNPERARQAWDRAERAAKDFPPAAPYERFLLNRLRTEAMVVWDIPPPRLVNRAPAGP
ncbi:MAG: hypothetical protein K2X82_31350, partial [Gemmataceae bacterium]|nr:hypothetical protein [Gemmataceae bacterium]